MFTLTHQVCNCFHLFQNQDQFCCSEMILGNVTTSFRFFLHPKQNSCKHCRFLLNISTKHIVGSVPTSWCRFFFLHNNHTLIFFKRRLLRYGANWYKIIQIINNLLNSDYCKRFIAYLFKCNWLFLFTSLIEMYFLIFTSSKVLFYLKNIVHPYTDSNELFTF